ncbi:MAG: DotI/IcmL family type IV secretion protein [Alphaproteobacteria bacterium]|nr:DotI/IcmL family type IV secretion protein [Alphaproteobacteria bacterium]
MKARIILSSLVVASLMLFSGVAHAGLLEFFFPSLKTEEPDPMQTLQAPFAADGQAPQLVGPRAVQSLPENAIPMQQPHRATRQITDWVVTVVSEAMTFDSKDMEAEKDGSLKYFNTGGRAQYEQFLKDSKLRNVIDSQKYSVRSYVRDAPLLLNEGEVKGYYRWLYEVPIMVSYMGRNEKDYRQATPVNQQMVITLQIGRSPMAEDSAGIVVESWSGKVQELDKK